MKRVLHKTDKPLKMSRSPFSLTIKWKRLSVFLFVSFLACLLGCGKQKPGSGVGTPSQQRTQPASIRSLKTQTTLTYASAANVFRLAAAADVQQAVKSWATARFKQEWATSVAPVFEGDWDQLHDFFSGAVTLVGAVEDSRCVVLFFNPWSDALLFVSFLAGDQHPTLNDFVFVSGELWRGQRAQSPKDILSRSSGRTLLQSVASVYAATVQQFGNRFPAAQPCVFNPQQILPPQTTETENIALVKCRLTLRMGMYLAFFAERNAAVLEMTGVVRQLLRSGNAEAWSQAFPPDQDKTVFDSIATLPLPIRETMGPVYFWQAQTCSVVVLMSSAAPRWFLLVEMDHTNGQERLTRAMLFDLELSSKYLSMSSSSL